MSKFKVGDRVRRTVTDGGSPPPNFRAGYETTVANVSWGTIWDAEGYGHSEACLEVIAHTGPIRTVTRREIVPGTYTLPSGGTYEISKPGDGDPKFVGFDDCEMDAVGLREMAAVFNEIADVLDEREAA